MIMNQANCVQKHVLHHAKYLEFQCTQCDFCDKHKDTVEKHMRTLHSGCESEPKLRREVLTAEELKMIRQECFGEQTGPGFYPKQKRQSSTGEGQSALAAAVQAAAQV